MSRIDETRPFLPVNIAVLTVSDSRTLDNDKSGAKLAAMLTADGHRLASREIVKDDIEAIVARPRDRRVPQGAGNGPAFRRGAQLARVGLHPEGNVS